MPGADELHQRVPTFTETIRISHMPIEAADSPEPSPVALDPVPPRAAEDAPGEEAVEVEDAEDDVSKVQRLKEICQEC